MIETSVLLLRTLASTTSTTSVAHSSKASKGGSHKCCLPLCARLLALCASSLAYHVNRMSANSCLIRARLIALYLCSHAMSVIIVRSLAIFVLGCWLSTIASMPCSLPQPCLFLYLAKLLALFDC